MARADSLDLFYIIYKLVEFWSTITIKFWLNLSLRSILVSLSTYFSFSRRSNVAYLLKFRKCPNNGTPFRDPCQTIAPHSTINRSKPEKRGYEMNGRRTVSSCRKVGAGVGGRKSMQLFNTSDSSGLDYRANAR